MNLANKITIIRILLIPIFLGFIYSDIKFNLVFATAIFIIAFITDGVDGYIARSRNQITTFGKFLDPLADKLMIMCAFIALIEIKRLSGLIAIAIIARELIITGFRAIAASDGVVIQASIWGKVKTVSQVLAVVLTTLNVNGYYIVAIISLIITIVSGIDYLYKNRNILSYK